MDTMTVLGVYASRHGATRQLADRLTSTPTAATPTAAEGAAADRPTDNAGDLACYDAFVIGACAGHWLELATEFIRSHRAALADRPVWLFSGGAPGIETTGGHGGDQEPDSHVPA